MALSIVTFCLLFIMRFPAIAPHDCGKHCPCYMDGIYYGHNEEWYDKDRQCVKYKCFVGYYLEIERGIPFRGKCYQLGDKWTDGCSTYEGVADGRYVYYRLAEGGCAGEEGDCWALGETREWNCVVRQCQIVDGCFKVVQLSAGCRTNEGCQRVLSHWHDGCYVYECRQKHGMPHVEKISDENVMDWPEGSYGMLKPKTGCPKNDKEEWAEGSRLHYSNGSNTWSFPFDLSGDYENNYFNHHFCIHKNNRESAEHLMYQTYWESGSYCILQYNLTCSEGFREGFVTTRDVPLPGETSGFHGTLPDGEYGEDFTTLKFCCRMDGDKGHPVVLPMRRPFIMFMVQGSGGCQEVRGMESEIQYFTFDDGDSNNMTKSGGLLPEVKFLNGDTTLYFCYYKPMECGCTDEDGDYIPLLEEIVEGCVSWRCVLGVDSSGMETPLLELYRGGCETLEGCKRYNTTWTEMEGETCSEYTCQSIHRGSSVQFVSTKTFQGCRDEDECRPLGHILGDGCFEMVCSQDAISGMLYYKAIKPGCKDFKGDCIPPSSTQTENCVLYQCQQHRGRFNLLPIEAGCPTESGCVKNSHNFTKDCDVLHCTAAVHQKKAEWKIQQVQRGCQWRGRCIIYQRTKTLILRKKYACFSYQCFLFGEKYIAMIVNRDCRDSNGNCIKSGGNIGLIKYQKKIYKNCLCHIKDGWINATCLHDNRKTVQNKLPQNNKMQQAEDLENKHEEVVLSDGWITEDSSQTESSMSNNQEQLEVKSVEDDLSGSEENRSPSNEKQSQDESFDFDSNSDELFDYGTNPIQWYSSSMSEEYKPSKSGGEKITPVRK